jgi:hypothetical protein
MLLRFIMRADGVLFRFFLRLTELRQRNIRHSGLVLHRLWKEAHELVQLDVEDPAEIQI